MNKKIFFSLSISILLSGLGFYYSFKSIPMNELMESFSLADFFWAIPTVVIVLLALLLRIIRWRIIIETSQKVRFSKAAHALIIGFFLNLILPGRVGELARPALLVKMENVPFTTGLATVIAERLLDLIMLMILLSQAFASIEIDPNINISFGEYQLNKTTLLALKAGISKLCLLLILIICAFSIKKCKDIITSLLDRLPYLFFFLSQNSQDKIHSKICTPSIKIIDNISQGLAIFKNKIHLVQCLLLSALIWLLQALSYYTMQFSYGLSLSYWEITTVMLIICIFIALPSVPGFWGIWEAGGIFALTMFGITGSNAAGYTLLNHVFQVLPYMIIGVVSLFMTGMNMKELLGKNSSMT